MAWSWSVPPLLLVLVCQVVTIAHGYPLDRSLPGSSEEIWGPAVASAALLGACVVVALLGCVCCRHSKSPPFQEFSDTASVHSLSAAGFVNPLAGVVPSAATTEFTIFPPPGVPSCAPASPPAPPPDVSFEPLPDIRPRGEPPPLRPAAFSSAAPAPSELLDEPSFPRERLKYLRELGQGWFGKVVEGEALEEGPVPTRVVVRILQEGSPAADQQLFLQEVASLRALSHPNLLRVLGCCCEPHLVIAELCPEGDLKSFLVLRRDQATDLMHKGEVTRLMCELAAGLEHMACAGFVHTDLAARNCQLTSDLTLKIGDYGTSIARFKEEYYCAGDVAVPIRWCAPESLVCTDLTIATQEVTCRANVWSLGVVLWEVLTFGQLPHADLSDDEVVVRVIGPERRLLPPPSSTLQHGQYLYHLMRLCWSTEAERPSAGHIHAMLRHLHQSRGQASESFDQRWAALRPNSSDLVEVHVLPSEAEAELARHRSPSLQNLRGSLEDLSTASVEVRDETPENPAAEELPKMEVGPCSLEDEDARRISEAIQDLDDALALEQTSSSESSSAQSTPRTRHARSLVPDLEPPTESENLVLDLRQPADSEEEEERWQLRVERGEFSEKVRHKSRSVQDLMVLTHIQSSSETSAEEDPATLAAFSSEGDLRRAVELEGLLDSFRQLHLLATREEAQPEEGVRASRPDSRESPSEFLSTDLSKYLISEDNTMVSLSDINVETPDEVQSFDNFIEAFNNTQFDADQFSAPCEPDGETRQMLNLEGTQRDSSSQSCSVTTSTEESDLTVLANPRETLSETLSETLGEVYSDREQEEGGDSGMIEGVDLEAVNLFVDQVWLMARRFVERGDPAELRDLAISEDCVDGGLSTVHLGREGGECSADPLSLEQGWKGGECSADLLAVGQGWEPTRDSEGQSAKPQEEGNLSEKSDPVVLSSDLQPLTDVISDPVQKPIEEVPGVQSLSVCSVEQPETSPLVDLALCSSEHQDQAAGSVETSHHILERAAPSPDNNNEKLGKCCSAAENVSESPQQSKSPPLQVLLGTGVKEPLSMIAFEPTHPKHHGDHRLRKYRENMAKELEFSKTKCKEVLKTEPVGMIAFDPSAPKYTPPEPLVDPIVCKATAPVTSEPAAPVVLKVERQPLISKDSSGVVEEALSTIAFEYIPSEVDEALILDTTDSDSSPATDSSLNSDPLVAKTIVVETLFKPKRLEQLCEEALILDVDESRLTKTLEDRSLEAIILDVDSTNLAEEICLANPSMDESPLDKLGAISRLDNLIRDSTDSGLRESSSSESWSSCDVRSKDLESVKCLEELAKRATPDDERSSDSGFKASLSESCDEGGDRYNLEDIEVELETFGQLGTPSSDSGLERTPHDDLRGFEPVDQGQEEEGEEFWQRQMVSLQQAAGQTLALFQEAASAELSPCEEEKAYASSWFRRSDEELSPKSCGSASSGTGGGDYLDEESVAAIRQELQEKLPRLERQGSEEPQEEQEEEEEEVRREDITVHYNIYPAPLSPILEEHESGSEIGSPAGSPGFFLHAPRGSGQETRSLSSSGSASPQGSPRQGSPLRQSPVTSTSASPGRAGRSEQFEADIRAALQQCAGEQDAQSGGTDGEEDEEEEEEDVLFINTETNEAKLVESPLRPKMPYLAFVNGQQLYTSEEWAEDDETARQNFLQQFDAVTSFSEPEEPSPWMAVPVTRAPMPSPEEEQARGVVSEQGWESGEQRPDWESDCASEGSSSSGEFVWREGDRASPAPPPACEGPETEEAPAPQGEEEEEREGDERPPPGSPSKPFEGLSEFPMAVIEEEDEDAGSTSSSDSEFVPSSWNSEAAPSRSSLRSPDRKSEQKKNVSFKRQKYHCVYEYPREPSDTEGDEAASRRQWGLPQPVTIDYSSYADWELLDDELTEPTDQDTDPDSSEHAKPEPFDFYKLSNIDYDFTNGSAEDGEFFISSSARPFHLSSTFSSQFFPGMASVAAAEAPAPATPTSPGGSTSSGGSSGGSSTTPPSPLSPTSAMGELRHTRDRLKLDLPKFSLAPIPPRAVVTTPPSSAETVDQSPA